MVFGSVFAFSFLSSIALFFFLMKVRKNPAARIMIVGVLLDSFWILTEGLPFFITDTSIGLFCQIIKYFGIIFIPPVFILMVNEYTNRKANNLLNTPIIFFVPIFSLISVFTNRFPYPFFSKTIFSFINGLPVFAPTREIGFWVHTYYSYALIVLACFFLLAYAFKVPKLYRLQSIIIFSGTVLSFVLNIIVVSIEIDGGVIDTTSISILLTMGVFYFGLFRMPKSIIKPFARDLLIESINDIVIILDSSDRVVDVNPAALKFWKTYSARIGPQDHPTSPDFTNMKINEIMESFPGFQTIHAESDSNDDSTLLIHQDKITHYFRVSQSPIHNSDHSQIGSLYMLHNITQQQEYLK